MSATGGFNPMQNHPDLPIHPIPPFLATRVDAVAICTGPASITARLQEQIFWGWPILKLEITAADADLVESRTVYADLVDDSQRVAVLRAVHWDGKSAKRAISTGQPFELALPARFTVLPVVRLRTWLSEFEGVSVSLHILLERDPAIDIRKLRIELDYKTWIFEKVWQLADSNHAILNQKWNKMWNEMTDILISQPALDDFYEDFWFVNPEVRYDVESYQPARYIPK